MPTKDIAMPWGKHKGRLLCDIPSDYLHWLFDKSEADDELKEAAEAEYEFRARWNQHFWDH